MSCGLFRAVRQMKINCEEDESSAARWQRSVGTEHLSKNNEEEKNGPDVIWELESVFVWSWQWVEQSFLKSEAGCAAELGF